MEGGNGQSNAAAANPQPRKVVFLTKSQRQQLKKQREAELQLQQKVFESVCNESKRLYEEVGQALPPAPPPAKVADPPKLKKKKESDGEQSGGSRSRSRSREKQKKEKKTKIPVRLTEEQLARIQDQERRRIKVEYLGLNPVKRREMRNSDKYKNVFNFEWADKDDTMQLASSIHMNKYDAKLLFGKGVRAGIDLQQQKAAQSNGTYKSKYDKIMEGWQTKKYEDMTERDWRIFREDNDILTKGGRIPNPIRTWEEAHLDLRLEDAIKRLGFKQPKPIQKQAITIGMAKKDMIALAPTGQGKTLAYLVPLIMFINNLPPITSENSSKGPYGLILAPARELAEQIAGEFEKLTLGLGCRSEVAVGGKKIEFQGLNLQQGCEVLIGTPGRIRELLEKHYVILSQCSWVIIDEADKMIDMDMEPDVHYILDAVGTELKSSDEEVALEQEQELHTNLKYRVTHLFSATMPPAIEKLAKKYLRHYCFISIGDPGFGKKSIQHFIEIIDESLKKNVLRRVVRELKAPIIVFVNQKRSCEIIRGVLSKWGRTAVEYHGGKSQEQREEAIEQFKQGKFEVLVATDLAGRGLHVDGVTAVINFDAPKNINDYIHRTGRTGRAGNTGQAYTFLTSADEAIFYDLKEFLVRNQQEIPEELQNHPASRFKPGTVAQVVPRRKQVLYAQ